MITVRKNKDRGHADHGWLKSFHTFSFANYYDSNFMNFGALRVINEDLVAPSMGFDAHPHKNMEIFSYVVSGKLAHRDSMGNEKIIKAGELQAMSAGSGVVHSEYNPSSLDPVHFIQIWITPNKKDIEPSYSEWKQKSIENDLTLLVSEDQRNNSLKINQTAEIYLGDFDKNKTLTFNNEKLLKVWLQVISGNLIANDIELEKGDGLGLENTAHIDLNISKDTKFLLFKTV
jgi:redox-sensitive bicupin YhaK (pirin superfamily)